MKKLLVAILGNPVILATIGLILLSYSFLLLVFIRRNARIADLAENGAVRFLLLSQSELMVTPFIHWNSAYLIIPPLDALFTHLLLVICGYIIFALWPKVKEFIRSGTFGKYFFGNPFIWLISLLGIASAIWSETPLIALKSGLVLLAINLFSLYVSVRFNWDDIFNFIRCNIAAIALLSFVVRRTTNAGTTEGGGLAGVLPSKNTLGAIMALGVTLFILQAIKDKKYRPISVLMALICMFILLQAKSGGGYFIFVMLMAVTLSSRFLKLFKFRYAVAISSVFFFLTLLTSFAIAFNLDSILGAVGKDANLTGRNKVWPAVITASSERIWTGYGMFSFWQPWRGSENPALDFWSSYWVPPSAHQGFLDVLLQLGVIGLTLILLTVAVSMFQGMKHLFKHQGVAAILPITVVLHHFLVNLPETRFLRPNVFWVSFVLVTIKLSIASTETVASRKRESKKNLNYIHTRRVEKAVG